MGGVGRKKGRSEEEQEQVRGTVKILDGEREGRMGSERNMRSVPISFVTVSQPSGGKHPESSPYMLRQGTVMRGRSGRQSALKSKICNVKSKTCNCSDAWQERAPVCSQEQDM